MWNSNRVLGKHIEAYINLKLRDSPKKTRFRVMYSCLLSSVVISMSILTVAKGSLLIFRLQYVTSLFRWRMSSATRLPPDPLYGYTLRQRQELCDEVINAEVFQYVPITATDTIPYPSTDNAILENFQRTAPTPDDPDPVILRYTDENVAFKPAGVANNLKMLPCVFTPNVKWYVTYGLKEKQLFLIEEKHISETNYHKKYLCITALIEPNSSIDFENWGPRNVQYWLRYIQSMRMEKINSKIIKANDVPDDMKLKKRHVLLGGQDYFRLCGSVLEILSSPRMAFFSHNITKSVNYVRNRLRGPKNRPRAPFQIKVDEGWARIKTEAFVTCCVARHVFGVPTDYQFFLLANPETLNSVFVFREVLVDPNNEPQLQFLAHVYNVTILNDHDDFVEPATPADAGPSSSRKLAQMRVGT